MFDYSATKGQVAETTSTTPNPSSSISNLNNGGGDGRGGRPRAGPASSYLSFGLDQEELEAVQKGVWSETITPTLANTSIPIRCTTRTRPPVVIATGTPPPPLPLATQNQKQQPERALHLRFLQ